MDLYRQLSAAEPDSGMRRGPPSHVQSEHSGRAIQRERVYCKLCPPTLGDGLVRYESESNDSIRKAAQSRAGLSEAPPGRAAVAPLQLCSVKNHIRSHSQAQQTGLLSDLVSMTLLISSCASAFCFSLSLSHSSSKMLSLFFFFPPSLPLGTPLSSALAPLTVTHASPSSSFSGCQIFLHFH